MKEKQSNNPSKQQSGQQQEQQITINVDQNPMVEHKKILIGDITKITGSDKALVKRLHDTVFYEQKDEKPVKLVFSTLKLIEALEQVYPGLSINNLGASEFILEYAPPTPKKKWLSALKMFFVCLSVFFGAIFAIMTFNQDVDVDKVFGILYRLLGFSETPKVKILEIGYCLGLPLGILLFFNHFSKIKIDSDPTPLEVQMRLYEQDVNTAIIQNASREGKLHDVD